MKKYRRLIRLLTILFGIIVSSGYSFGQCCIEPQSETTQVAGTNQTTATEFSQIISDAYGDSFDGMSVMEGNAATGADTCWSNTSPWLKQTSVTGGSWTVAGNQVPGQHNHWGYDYVGATLPEIQYYRAYNPGHGLPLPCGWTFYQSMQIWCDNSWITYTPSYGNKLTITIDFSSVVNCRNDMDGYACQTIND